MTSAAPGHALSRPGFRGACVKPGMAHTYLTENLSPILAQTFWRRSQRALAIKARIARKTQQTSRSARSVISRRQPGRGLSCRRSPVTFPSLPLARVRTAPRELPPVRGDIDQRPRQGRSLRRGALPDPRHRPLYRDARDRRGRRRHPLRCHQAGFLAVSESSSELGCCQWPLPANHDG